MEIQSLEIQDKIALLLVGESGSGKTYFAASASKLFPVYYLNIEKKKATLAQFKDTLTTVRTAVNAQEIINIMQQFAESEYELMVIDSLAHLQIMTLHEITRGQKATLQQFGILNNYLLSMMLAFPWEEKHLICTTPCREIIIDKEVHLKPALIGQFGEMIGRWFNIMAYLESNKKNYSIHFSSGQYFSAKSEFPQLPDELENAEFPELYQLIGGEVTTEHN